MRLVLDTDVVVAAMRSPIGASAALVAAAKAGRIRLVCSVPLAVEYEAVCRRMPHRTAASFALADVDRFLDALIDIAEPVFLRFSWRPMLNDPADEMVLETAINGHANAIVTFNRRHYLAAVPSFGIECLLPSEAMRGLRS
jgi:putative PIN family toxin of toxin-antitoxin system